MSANGLPYTRSASYGLNSAILAFFLASSNVTSGITTPNASDLMRIFSSAFSRFVSRKRRMSG